MTPEEEEAERLRKQAERLRKQAEAAQQAEAQRLAEEAARQETAANKPMMQPTDLMGQQGQQETGMDTNPMLMGGLGLGGGYVASQTGGAPATSQVLSSFAQKVAAQDAATRAAQRAAFNPAIIGQNLPAGGANPAVTGTPKLPFQTPSSVFGSNLPAGGVNPEVKGRVKPNVFNKPNIKSTTPLTPNKIIGGLNANPLSNIAGNLLKNSAYTAAIMPNPIGDSSLRGAYNNAVAAGEDPAVAAARLGTEDTSILGLDKSNRKVATVDGRGVLNGVNLFTGDAASTGSNYADLVNADRARSELLSRPSPEEDTFVEPLDFAGEIQNNPEQYSGLIENNPFTSLGGTPVQDNPYTVAREAGEPSPNALLDLAEREGALGPKLTDIFQGRAEPLSARTENPIDATDPGPVAAPGSPQAIFEGIRAKGALSPELIAAGQKRAEAMGTTFDPETGFSRDPFQQAQQAQQAERGALANRPGYGYGGAVNDQYQSADFDTISQGVFDTPMTGMRPINSETGEPLSQGVIDAAARAGLELPMGSVPLPKAPVNSVPMGQDETRARLGGMTLNQYLNAPDGAVSGLRTDPQGRMIPSRGRAAQDGVFAYDDMTRADAYGQYEDEVSQAYQRQSERMQQRADQRDGTAGPRTYGGYTTAQLRGMVGGGDNLRAAQMRAEAGLNPVTGNREKTAEERQLSTDILNAQLNKLEKSEPNKYNSAVSEVESLVASGILPADKSREAILSKLGYDLEELLGIDGTGAGGGGGSFTEAQQSSISKVMAANPGSSREQIIAEMKKQGKL